MSSTLQTIAALMLSSYAWSLRCRFVFSSSLHKPYKSMFASAAETVKTSFLSQRIKNINNLKSKFTQLGIDAFIIPTDDPHLSEYTAAFYNRREFISGFTGSAGTAIITKNQSLLFTDGRYHNQASLELDETWTLMKQGLKDVPTITEFLADNLPPGAIVAIDPFLHSAEDYKTLNKKMTSKGISVKCLQENPIDSIWGDNRPLPPCGKVRVHPEMYAGKSVQTKLTELREKLLGKSARGIISAALDEIAWLFNIRGADVPCNPVAVAYAVVTLDTAFLFIDSAKLTDEVRAHLAVSGVQVRPYESTLPLITEIVERGDVLWIDTKKVNHAIYSLANSSTCVEADSPVVLMKACKNEAELTGMRSAHIRDGAAMADFYAWLEKELLFRSVQCDNGHTTDSSGSSSVQEKKGVNEVEIDEVSTRFRKEAGMFVDLSFPTIAGVESNGAIIHYRAVPETCKTLFTNELILLDSGAQYEDGTTDVTRTFHTGTPTEYEREMFTRVLKGHISIDKRIFPAGTPGCLLDSFAREHLWAVGKDFLHGVGHGVGAALNVHEGPHSISRSLNSQPLLPGMIVSNEPGYYEEGNFGIRIENLLVVVNKTDFTEYRGRGFLGFERLTHIPIQKKLIEKSLLTDVEVEWVNNYHREVMEKVMPHVKTSEGRSWLIESTTPL